MTVDIPKLRALLAKAGKWPTEPVKSYETGYFDCPACGGCGQIAAEDVKQIHAGLVGVQIFGIGDQMAAMEELVPLLLQHGPALLSELEALREVISRPDLSAAMRKMDEVGFGKWESACEIARYSIMAQVVDAALDKARKEAGK
jgi:hypothetical protein